MNDLPCPSCNSSLYTQTFAGFVCLAYGYKEEIERHQPYAPRFKSQPAYLDVEVKKWYDVAKWQQAYTPYVPPTYGISDRHRDLLNGKFRKVRQLLIEFDQYGRRSDLKIAESLIMDCLRYAHEAKNTDSLNKLHNAVKLRLTATEHLEK